MTIEKRISKSILSMFLRSKCDRELFLSLHTEATLAANGMPAPLQARPGIGVLQTAGKDFEDERNEQLISAFGALAVYQPERAAATKPVAAPLATLLGRVSAAPSVVLQGKFEPAGFQRQAMSNIGLSHSFAQNTPPIAGLIPDILIVREPMPDDEEVAPNGSRKPIAIATEARRAVCVVDVKHTSEANPSYCAEVALYALMLSNWLVHENLHAHYYVTSRGYLWTRFKQGESALNALMASGATATPLAYLEALIADCEDANLRFYLPTVLHFFREDIPRVLAVGSATPDGWKRLEWHVDGRCSACDWLGHEKWASSKDKARITANPEHYCFSSAKQCGHLSQIAGLTRGARKTLQAHAIQTTTAAAASTHAHAAFQQHSHLKKECRRIPARAHALVSATTTIDSAAVLASLAPWPQFYASVAVNFDPSSGLLTGLSVTGRATAYVTGQSPRNFRSTAFLVDQKDLNAEWVALEGLLSHLSDIITQSEAFVTAAGKTPLTAQISFWEKRQYDELCAAMGRHLPRVFALSDRKTRALAWLFPADELLEKADGAVSPCVVFIDDIVRRVVFAPTPHVITLYDTAEVYHAGPSPVRQNDAFYREFLTNGIPRERIYEIWSNAAVIKRGSVTIPRGTVIHDFSSALDKQCQALSSIVEKLRSDFKDHLKANAPRLTLSVPQGARGVSFDGKLWAWWDELQHQTRKLESHQRLVLDAETLEAAYEAIRLTNGRATGAADCYEFDVLPGSTEAKLDDNEGFLALGKEGLSGLPLYRASDILKPSAPAYSGQDQTLKTPLWSSLSVELMSLDRSHRRAVIRLRNYREPRFFQYLVAHGTVDLLNDVFVTKGQSTFKWYEKSLSILRCIADPPIATPDAGAVRAMGYDRTRLPRPGSDPITPAARVLWQADVVNQQSVISAASAAAIADYAVSMHRLNPSQRDAVAHAAEKGLSIIWGPPGTGKTKTLAGFIHGLLHDAHANGKHLKLLVSGPTYKAVEELIHRVVRALDADASCPASIFVAYSRSHPATPVTSSQAHLRVESFNLEPSELPTQRCLSSMQNQHETTIVATSTMQAYKFADWICGRVVGGIFDVVIIDESSQVQVTQAISPIGTLKDTSRLVIAGDHLQLPPITALEAPAGSEYLVGSIQQYLLKRTFGRGLTACSLDENYRSAKDIVDYAKTIGYEQRLRSAYPDTALHPRLALSSVGLPAGLPPSDLWVEALRPERKVLTLLHNDELSSQGNAFEANMVASLTWILRNTMSQAVDGQGSVTHGVPSCAAFWDRCVGIVTPHRAQRALVIRALQKAFPADSVDAISAAVDTVEKFQGGERHTIIVAFGIGDADVIAGEEAFLMQLERTNVAISRAMAKCIVIMPMALAGHVPHDKRALQTAHAIKGYVDEFCNREIDGTIGVPGAARQAKLRYRG